MAGIWENDSGRENHWFPPVRLKQKRHRRKLPVIPKERPEVNVTDLFCGIQKIIVAQGAIYDNGLCDMFSDIKNMRDIDHYSNNWLLEKSKNDFLE